VLSALMHSSALARGDARAAVSEATEAAANLFGVRRASVWLFRKDPERIECIDLFDAKLGEHSSGITLLKQDAPKYFSAARAERVIAAHDARTDARTNEFAATYLVQNAIFSMLDAPVYVHGELAGIVCLEHVGEAREWEPADELVVATISDFVGVALGTAAHIEQARELSVLRDNLEVLVEKRTQELRASQSAVRRLFETSPVALVVTRIKDQTVLLANERAARLFEIPLADVAGQNAPDFWVHPDDRKALVASVREIGRHDGLEAELKTSSGKRFWAHVSATTLDFEGVQALVVGVLDITAQKTTEETLRMMLEAAPIPLVVMTLDDAVLRFANTRAADKFKTSVDELTGKQAPDFFFNSDDRTAFIDSVRASGRVDAFGVRLKAGNDAFWSLLSARTLDLGGTRALMVGFFDITEQKEIEQRLRGLAELDGLTGAFNRRHFFDVAGPTVDRIAARGGSVCLAMLDADHFKSINDRFGHAMGDETLRTITQICRNASRTTDIVARYGGEELVLLLSDVDKQVALGVVERIRTQISSTSIPIGDGESFSVSVSIGLAQHVPGESLEALLQRADTALYKAKRSGRDRVVIAG
jgi:diguanylate cyclase (GGDEF)-like protein/PAS domain S-box-containing protein